MTSKFLLKDIAYQAGLSLATVDRVLHGRAGVRAVTRARVEAAIRELERQSEHANLTGRRFTIDVVMQVTDRFARACRAAFEAEVPGMQPASFRCRFHFSEYQDPREVAELLLRIRKRGSHGVVLKAPDSAFVVAAVKELTSADIPVVTFASDIGSAERIDYVGFDNRRAGSTAAYFIGQCLGDRKARVLTVLSSRKFNAEALRQAGFQETMAQLCPGLETVSVSEGFGINQHTGELVSDALAKHPDIAAVYSIGGGNKAIIRAFAEAHRECLAFVAHDLDDDNLELLQHQRITVALHNDLRRDARTACQLLLRHHRMLPPNFQSAPALIDVATPYNLPSPCETALAG